MPLRFCLAPGRPTEYGGSVDKCTAARSAIYSVPFAQMPAPLVMGRPRPVCRLRFGCSARKERDRRDGAAPKLDTSATLVKLNTQKRDLRTTAQIQQEMQEAKRKQPDAAGGGGGAGDGGAKGSDDATDRLQQAQLRAAGLDDDE